MGARVERLMPGLAGRPSAGLVRASSSRWAEAAGVGRTENTAARRSAALRQSRPRRSRSFGARPLEGFLLDTSCRVRALPPDRSGAGSLAAAASRLSACARSLKRRYSRRIQPSACAMSRAHRGPRHVVSYRAWRAGEQASSSKALRSASSSPARVELRQRRQMSAKTPRCDLHRSGAARSSSSAGTGPRGPPWPSQGARHRERASPSSKSNAS